MLPKLLKVLFGILLVTYSHSSAQKKIAEFEIPDIQVDKLKGMVMNDSLFLSMELFNAQSSKGINEYYWIRSNGSRREVDLSAISNKPIFAISNFNSDEYYYYLNETAGGIFIKSLIIDQKTGVSRISKSEINIKGNVYGSYINDNDLYILTAIKGGYSLVLTRVRADVVVEEIVFRLSFDLGALPFEKVQFKEQGIDFIPHNGVGSVMITKEDNIIWISIDEPRNEYDRSETNNALYKTTVVKLDIKYPEVSFVKAFFETTHSQFSSKISNGILFRVFSDFNYHFDAIDIETGAKVYSRIFERKKDFGTSNVYLRSEASNSINKTTTNKPLAEISLRFINAEKDSSSYLLTVGGYYLVKPSTPLVSVLGLGGILVSAAVQAIVREMNEGKMSYSYTHVRIGFDGSFTPIDKTNLLVQKIDDYELENYNGVMGFRGYLSTIGSVYGIYKKRGIKQLQIVRFDR
jgi:hypothetical protein